MIKKAILPVAGLGTRFLPASKSIPKEMVTVVDRPAIEYVVKEAIAAGADGAISGSAIVKIIEKHHAEPEIMLAELKRFVSSLKAATR